MAQSLQSKGTRLTVHYAGKNIEEMPFSDRLKKALGDALTLYSSKENQRIDIKNILLSAGQSDIFYLIQEQLDDVVHHCLTQKIVFSNIHLHPHKLL